jgi:hypothetical protein
VDKAFLQELTEWREVLGQELATRATTQIRFVGPASGCNRLAGHSDHQANAACFAGAWCCDARVERVPVTTAPAAAVVRGASFEDPDTAFPPIVPWRPPKDAPNMLIVLIDDCCFGAASAFGGPIATPNADRLAPGGLKFNRFHTTALCSPTRQALLTGRNHHSVNMGGICEIATSAPGYTSVLPKDKAPPAMTLKLNGYSTAQFGKCHEVPVWETSPLGPFDQWPSGGGGFEYFYGFIGGETNQWYPALYEGTTPMEQGRSPEEGCPTRGAHRRPRSGGVFSLTRRRCPGTRGHPPASKKQEPPREGRVLAEGGPEGQRRWRATRACCPPDMPEVSSGVDQHEQHVRCSLGRRRRPV